MSTLLLKLTLAPLLITAVTLAGRRWGPGVSGWLIGFPLTSGPVSLILALQDGPRFTVQAALGTMAGQGATVAFCLAYYFAARRRPQSWPLSALAGVSVYFVIIALVNLFQLSLLPTLAGLVLLVAFAGRAIPPLVADLPETALPGWDLPARMLVAGLFVLALTSASAWLGAQVAGLLSPFPTFGLTLVAFAHQQQGVLAARKLLRGMVTGALAFVSFFVVVAALLPLAGTALTYTLAVLTTLGVNFTSLVINRRKERKIRRGIATEGTEFSEG